MSEKAIVRPFAVVGERVLADGTRSTHFALVEAADIEAALRRAARVVHRWRGARMVGPPEAVREITAAQVTRDRTA